MITGSKKRRQKEHGRESPMIRISVRNLVEFILREGNIDNRTGGGQDPENMQMGSRIHRKIQRQMGSDYQAEVPLKTEIVCDGFTLKIEGRADGLIHTKEQVMVDEIKGVLRELDRCRSRQAFIWHRQNVMPAW